MPWYEIETGHPVQPDVVENYRRRLERYGHRFQDVERGIEEYYTQDRSRCYRVYCRCNCGGRVRRHNAEFLPGHHWGYMRQLQEDRQYAELDRRGWPRQSAAARRFALTADRNFGFEAEFFGCHENQAVEAMREAGLEAHDDGYHHQARPFWRVTTDGSVHNEGLELVSPILRRGVPGFTQSKTAVDALRNAGARIDVSCGLHVHHDGAMLTGHDIRQMLGHYALFQPLINRILPRSRRSSSWARPVDYEVVERNAFDNGRVEWHHDKHDIARAVNYYVGGRYRAVNLEAMDAHGTIEFRQHSGTLNAQKIRHWVQFTKLIMNSGRAHNIFDLVQEHGSFDQAQNHFTVESMLTYLGAPTDTIRFYVDRETRLNPDHVVPGVVAPQADQEDIDATQDLSHDEYDEDECDHCWHSETNDYGDHYDECCHCGEGGW